MIRLFSALAVLSASLALASPAFAAPDKAEGKGKGGGPAKQFERFDRNNDGVVDADEVKQQLQRFMKRADTNKDGVVDADEIKALKDKAAKKSERQANNVAKKIKKLDTNGDGKITETEALTRPGWFDRADKDKDGKVTKAEIDELASKRRQRDEAKADKKAKAADDKAKEATAKDAAADDDEDEDDEE